MKIRPMGKEKTILEKKRWKTKKEERGNFGEINCNLCNR